MKKVKIPKSFRKLRVGEYANRMDRVWNHMDGKWMWWDHPHTKVRSVDLMAPTYIRKKK